MKHKPGKRVRELRRAREMTLADLAKRARMHKSSMSRIENGKQGIRGDELIRLARALDCSADDILGIEGAAA